MGNYYSKRLIQEFLSAKNVGELPNPDLVVEISNPVCTADSPPSPCLLKVYFKLDGFVIKDVKFKLQGCVPAVAFMSVLTEKLKGKDLKSALEEISKEEIINELCGIPENKLFCPIIGLSVIELALQKLSSEK